MNQAFDKPKEFCGVFGIYNHAEAAEMTYLSLYTLQHRGQEGAGIVSSDGNRLHRHVGRGLVNDVFGSHETIEKLLGHIAIGHNRYSTTGSDEDANVQPILVKSKNGMLALGHNGNLVNSRKIRRELESEGALFQTSTDTEVIVHLIARSKKEGLVEQIKDALSQVRGAYSLLIMTKNKLIAARDPSGVRPLAIGKLKDSHIVTSETCALDLIGAEYIRDVKPGELLIFDENGMKSESLGQPVKPAHCIFELIYFSRPDSRIFGEYVDKTRRKFGKMLAAEYPIDADIVISVPDSSNTAALGYSHRTGMRFELGLIRNHYIGRTFIQPQQAIRDFNVRVKFNPVGGVLEGRRVVVVEDSIVRGTTLKMLVNSIRKVGAKEVHVLVSSPPIRYPCFYGMDFPTRAELIANKKTVDEIRDFIDVDSLGYLSLEGLLSAVPDGGKGYCAACFNGCYPIPIDEKFTKNVHEVEGSKD
ncbi:amidophosphoribosyltransferase [candidate division KSB1 bacterium]|nr:amidophosphoribosyltransferase [candidate division KSB1 bacterium]